MERLISNLMTGEHKKIEIFLERFEKALEINLEEAKKMFNIFKWTLEKHFFIEERAIFVVNDSVIGQEVDIVFELLKQHGELMEIVKEIEENLNNDVAFNFKMLKEKLTKHSLFEDDEFYPKLDEELEHEKKQEIIERIKEIIRG